MALHPVTGLGWADQIMANAAMSATGPQGHAMVLSTVAAADEAALDQVHFGALDVAMAAQGPAAQAQPAAAAKAGGAIPWAVILGAGALAWILWR